MKHTNNKQYVYKYLLAIYERCIRKLSAIK